MEYQLIDGKATATAIKQQIAEEVKAITKAGGKQPHLVAILVGHDGGSETYVKNKVIACEQCGFKSTLIRYEADVTEDELLACVDKLNKDDDVDGFIVQLPLPKHIDEQKIIMAIDYRKDVDGFHPYNVGRLCQRIPTLRACTPYGVMKLLETTDIDLHGKHAVIVGASNIVGRPMSLELLLAGATVTVTHRFTKDLESHVRQADILVVSVGKPNLIPGDWIKESAVVIDVGINRVDGKLVGDVEFDKAAEKAAYITPVPGGVGPMTVAMLMSNTLYAYEHNK